MLKFVKLKRDWLAVQVIKFLSGIVFNYVCFFRRRKYLVGVARCNELVVSFHNTDDASSVSDATPPAIYFRRQLFPYPSSHKLAFQLPRRRWSSRSCRTRCSARFGSCRTSTRTGTWTTRSLRWRCTSSKSRSTGTIFPPSYLRISCPPPNATKEPIISKPSVSLL